MLGRGALYREFTHGGVAIEVGQAHRDLSPAKAALVEVQLDLHLKAEEN